ncbi:carboxymuconolactone decarboxylase family protein [Gordonia sp. (in: high G+C Gram-positive bacteria)]|uniref:carboxymuconolactone decarboxylase family protein n=1 Tax=Gordonia sp. (in: high G+C Gram-positive bacteria) TaxID=84139 RepID=UPI0016A96620|nr:carboxymuconolactone decarboxylase family protein [Gordonia sp. (in: high G+C Gram-positive bacteria)]NLG44972.1 carboxymuconolactone decarboxylase family protein [Gordonia sp. (in: high G+C Gram-positive bacteria)]
MSDARVEPGRLAELGPINWLVVRAMSLATGTDNAHIFATLGRSKGLFRGWLHYSSRMMPFGELSRKETEMIIIRVAHLRGCDYELDHHRRLGAKAGITGELYARILDGPDAGWGDRERTLLLAVDELVGTRDITDGTWQALRRHLTERKAIAFLLLVGQYDSLATTIGVLRVQRDTFAPGR